MHVIVLVDGLPENHEKFKQWLHTRKDKHPSKKKWNPQIRELRLYDLVVPEEVADDWIADIKATTGYGGCGGTRENKIQTAVKWLGKLVGLQNCSDVEPTKEDVKQNAVPDWWVHSFVIGKLDDPRYHPDKYPKKKGKGKKIGEELM